MKWPSPLLSTLVRIILMVMVMVMKQHQGQHQLHWWKADDCYMMKVGTLPHPNCTHSMLCPVGVGAGPAALPGTVDCGCFGLSGVWWAPGRGGGVLGLWGLLPGWVSAWGVWLLGGWECAAPGRLVLMPVAVWALFTGPLVFCPWGRSVVVHGLLSVLPGRGRWVFRGPVYV